MKLAIISDCVHARTPDGKVGSDVHIFVRQMEALSSKFSEVRIYCPFIEFDAATQYTVYSNPKIVSFHPLKKVGGTTVLSKLKILAQLPSWFNAYKQACKYSDIIYQRFPNNVNLPGLFFFLLKRKRTFGTYTGTWDKNNTESIAYTLVKWLLVHVFKGPVGVYTNQDKLPKHIFSSFSPSYNLSEWKEEVENVEAKIARIKSNGLPVIRMATVGTLIAYKNQQYILNTCLQLKFAKIPFKLYVIGDGELRLKYEKFVAENNMQNNIVFLGKLKFSEVRKYYREVDFVVQAPTVEGFGKVPIEGYFHGAIPVINNITLASSITQNERLGYLFNVNDKQALFSTLSKIYSNPIEIIAKIEAAREFVKKFTLENWADDYYTKLIEHYSLEA